MDNTLVIGPLVSGFGFRSWFWVCRPEQIVAVPAGFWVAMHCATVEGIGGVFTAPPGGAQLSTDLKLVPDLFEMSDRELREYSRARVYRLQDIESIKCQPVLVGHHPNVVIVEVGGPKTKFGLANAKALPAVRAALQEAYGELEVT
jgi:hypothetical protein